MFRLHILIYISFIFNNNDLGDLVINNIELY